MLDVELRRIIESLTSTEEAVAGWPRRRRRAREEHRSSHCMSNGRLHVNTPTGVRICVPLQSRFGLLDVHHRVPCLPTTHRGYHALYEYLRQFYHWPRMQDDCREYVKRCEVCANREMRSMQDAHQSPIPEAPYPFHTIAIDHKSMPHPSGSEQYTDILIVVDTLTRFTIAIPVTSQDTERNHQGINEPRLHHLLHASCHPIG